MARIVMLEPWPDTSPLTAFAKEEFRHLGDLTITGTETGLDTVASYRDIEYHVGPLLDKAVKLEKSGDYDALILGCFGDPGIFAVRQAISLPVVGAGHSTLCVAAMVGDKIGIVVPQKDFVYITEKLVDTYRFADHVVAVRSAEDFVPESIQTRPEEAVAKMARTCLRVIRDDDADVVIFGCIGFSWMVEQIRALLSREGIATPIVEPGITSYRSTRLLLDLKLNQDRRKLATGF
jgi:allantoin racemase